MVTLNIRSIDGIPAKVEDPATAGAGDQQGGSNGENMAEKTDEEVTEVTVWLTKAKLVKMLEGVPDDAICVVENGTLICKPVRTAEAFRGKPVEHKGGNGYRLGAGGDARLIVLTVS